MLMLPVVILMLGGMLFAECLPPKSDFSRRSPADGVVVTTMPKEVTSRESEGTTTTSAATGDNLLGFTTMSTRLPSDEALLPTLANGHLGFTVFGDAIYMNGLYNGHRGLSHRARIANVANLRLLADGNQTTAARMDFSTGTFCVDYRGPNNSYRVVQLIYPHQVFNRAIVNQFTIERLDVEGDIHIGVIQNSSFPASEDIVFNSAETIFISHDAERRISLLHSAASPQKNFQQTRAVNISGDEYSAAGPPPTLPLQVHQACGTTLELEDSEHQHQQRHVCVLWNHVPEELTLKRSERTVSYKFIMTADESASVAREELVDAIILTNDELLHRHTNVWSSFWGSFDIQVEGNPELELIIRSSVFYMISNFPLGTINREELPRPYLFGGLSPTGLGRGGTNLADYEGHSMWDADIWMFPVVNLIESRFSKMMVDYRFRRRAVAEKYAKASGYRGVRFPWESASSGVEVTQPCCPEVAQFQHHITADVSFALRQYFSATQNLDWLQTEGCPLAQAIAEFWASRVSLDPVTGLYDIKAVMGPDEDHENVTNNAYTNVIAAYALYFGDLTKCLCSHGNKSNRFGDDKEAPTGRDDNSGTWSAMARHIKLIYDAENDYHPQYEGYQLGTVIKQADTVLLGFPLQYQGMSARTRSNDLRFYEAVTRRSGPAMTWAMHAINHLELGEMAEAFKYFERSYKGYVRGPFHVWNEVESGESGATNFITGAGGFLQAVLYGFGGIRLFLDRLQIFNARLPPGSTKLEIKGFRFLGASFTLKRERLSVNLAVTQTTQNLTIQIGADEPQPMQIFKTYKLSDMTTTIKAEQDIFKYCPIPTER